MEANRLNRANFRNLTLFNSNVMDADGNVNQVVLSSEIDYLQGRNEELNKQLTETRNESVKYQYQFQRAQEEVNFTKNSHFNFRKFIFSIILSLER